MILIVAPPGDLQIGLQALLSSSLPVDVLVTGAGSSAVKIIAKYNPTLVFLDEDLPFNNVQNLIQQIKTNWPQMCCFVFVNEDEGRQNALCEAADQVIIKGLAGGRLVTIIKEHIFGED